MERMPTTSLMREDRELKKEVSILVMSTRKAGTSDRESQPRFVSYDSVVRPDGSVAVRKKVILMTRGCSVPTCTMCPFTNENLYKTRTPVGLMEQVRSVLTRTEDEPRYTVMALYNDGNFFADAEISTDLR